MSTPWDPLDRHTSTEKAVWTYLTMPFLPAKWRVCEWGKQNSGGKEERHGAYGPETSVHDWATRLKPLAAPLAVPWSDCSPGRRKGGRESLNGFPGASWLDLFPCNRYASPVDNGIDQPANHPDCCGTPISRAQSRRSLIQDFFFGESDFMLRRHNCNVNIAGGFPAAQLTSNYGVANGIHFPTRRRAYYTGA